MISVLITVLALWFQVSPGTVHGRVTLRETGEPVAGLQVSLTSTAYHAEGIPALVRAAAVNTDKNGEYSISAPPQRYFIETGVTAAGTQNLYASSEAQAFDLTSGSDKQMDFVVVRGRKVRVFGQLVDGLGHRLPHLDWIWGVGSGPRVRYQNAGTYEINDVAPGSYFLRSYRFDDIERRAESVIPVKVRGDQDVEVDIVSEGSYDLDGRIRVQGSGFWGLTRPEFRIFVRDVNDPARIAIPGANISPEGRLSFLPVPAGSYRISILGVPPPFYVKSAGIGGNDILDSGFVMPGKRPGRIDIVFADDGGEIFGQVLEANRSNEAKVTVVLIPESHGVLRPDLYKSVQAGDDGQFVLRGIAPGAYRLYAWKQLQQGAYFDAGFMKRFEPSGTRVQVTSKVQLRVDLRLLD